MGLNNLLDGVVAMWPLNNNFGDSLDVYASGGGGTTYPFKHEAGATISVSSTLFVPGLAKSFSNNSANRMSAEDSVGQVFASGDNDFTVMAWVFAFNGMNSPYLSKWPSDAVNNSWILWNRSATNSHRFTMSSDGSATETIVEIANPDSVGAGSIWQLVIAGYDSGTEEIWMSLDGGTKVRVAHTGGAFDGGNQDLAIGWFATIFGGQNQDECAYWDIQLSDEKIDSIWNSGSGLRMTEWDATVPEADGSAILTSLVSYFNGYEASGQDRVDLHSGANTMSEAGAGAPIAQGTGLPAVAKTTASVDFSSNSASPEYLEKTSPVGMGGGTDSFTICAFVEFDHNENDSQGLVGRWLGSSSNRQFLLSIGPQPTAFLAMNTSADGGVGIVSATALEDFTAQNNAGSQVRFVVGWYDGDANTTNIQLSNGAVVTAAGPSTIFDSAVPFEVGFFGPASLLVGQAAFWGYWRRVLTQPERTFIFNFFGGQPYEALVAADQGNGNGAAQEALDSYNYYWSQRRALI